MVDAEDIGVFEPVSLIVGTTQEMVTLLGGPEAESRLNAKVHGNGRTVKLGLDSTDKSGDHQDAEQGDVGEGVPDQGSGDGDPGEGKGEESGEGEESGDPSEFEVPFPASGEGPFEDESEAIDHELIDNIWTVIKPRVVQIAEGRAGYAAGYVRNLVGSGRGGSGGITVRVSGKKTGKVVGVTHFQFPKVLSAVSRGLNVYLPGEPGTGKSHMAYQIAEALGVEFGVTSFSPMSTESKLIGFRTATGDTVHTVYRDRYVYGGICLLDELDNANPAIVAGLNSGLANGFQEFPDGVHERHESFVAIATANTFGTGPTAEFAGRQKLDPATLNRFVKIYIGTDEAMETHLVEAIIGSTQADRLLSKLRHYRRAVADLRIKTFITMRDSLNAARLIAPGDGAFTIPEALEMTCLGILTEDQVSKIKNWRG